MRKHYEMRFAGSGGQGMMLMGDIFAQAAGGFAEKEIVLTRSYGPEARGGACRSELIIDDERSIGAPWRTCQSIRNWSSVFSPRVDGRGKDF